MIIDVLDSIKSILQANLPAKLTSVGTARGLTLPNISKYFLAPETAGYFDNAPITDFPLIFIIGERSPEAHLAVPFKHFTHNVLLAFLIRDVATPENIYRKVYAYAEAIEKTLNTNHTLNNTVIKAEIVSSDYTVALRSGNSFVYGATMEMEILERVSTGG